MARQTIRMNVKTIRQPRVPSLPRLALKPSRPNNGKRKA